MDEDEDEDEDEDDDDDDGGDEGHGGGGGDNDDDDACNDDEQEDEGDDDHDGCNDHKEEHDVDFDDDDDDKRYVGGVGDHNNDRCNSDDEDEGDCDDEETEDGDKDGGPLILSEPKKRSGDVDWVGTLNPKVLQFEIDEGKKAKTTDGSDENTLRAGDKIAYYHPMKVADIWNRIDGDYILKITAEDEWVETMGGARIIEKDQQIKLMAKWNTKENTHIPVKRIGKYRTVESFDIDPSLNGKFTKHNWPTYVLQQQMQAMLEEAYKK
jgi:hypothetical protein